MTRPVRFTVPGKPVGYYTRGSRPDYKRLRAYIAYKLAVSWHAKVAGLRLPLRATELKPVRVDVVCQFSSRVHPDCENIRKGIVDALFYGAKGGDKYVWGMVYAPQYTAQDEVIVTVRNGGR